MTEGEYAEYVAAAEADKCEDEEKGVLSCLK